MSWIKQTRVARDLRQNLCCIPASYKASRIKDSSGSPCLKNGLVKAPEHNHAEKDQFGKVHSP